MTNGTGDAGDRVDLGDRVALEPLRAEHAEEMWQLLDDARLHRFTGGVPDTREELGRRYERQARGRSPDGRARWLNWIVRRREDGRAIGFVQATVTEAAPAPEAALAWTIAAPYQGQGYAAEAARAMAALLRADGIERLTAHIHPDHAASIAVARALGLDPTSDVVDGEIRFATAPPAPR